MNARAGFLIVKTFERMHAEFRKPFPRDHAIYSLPLIGAAPEQLRKKYRGIARDPLQPWFEELRSLPLIAGPEPSEVQARLRMTALENAGMSEDDFVFDRQTAYEVFHLLAPPVTHEVIWAADVLSAAIPPIGSTLLGYDVTWFTGDHFSAISDCMCFPTWHGTDLEGTLFALPHEQLNSHALFDSPNVAADFLAFYRSHDWTETGDYIIAEIRSVPLPG